MPSVLPPLVAAQVERRPQPGWPRAISLTTPWFAETATHLRCSPEALAKYYVNLTIALETQKMPEERISSGIWQRVARGLSSGFFLRLGFRRLLRLALLRGLRALALRLLAVSLALDDLDLMLRMLIEVRALPAERIRPMLSALQFTAGLAYDREA